MIKGCYSGFLLGLLFLAVLPDHAQAQASVRTLDPTLRLTQYVHTAWEGEEDLPQNSVFALAQTSDGYLWIGTQEGLARFDGVEFSVFDKLTPGLLSSDIYALLEDRRGTLWIGTNGGGLSRYQNGQFMAYTTADGLPSNEVRTLYEARDGMLWIGTIGGGLVRFDGKTFLPYPTQDGSSAEHIAAIEEDADGLLWVGTFGGGVFQVLGDTLRPYAGQTALPHPTSRTFLRGAEGAFWIGTDKGLVRLAGGETTRWTTRDGLCGDVVHALLRDAAGALWIGTYDGGLCRYYDGRFDAFTAADGLTHTPIRSLMIGREGALWIGTDGGGLNRLWDGKFTSFTTAEGLSNDLVTTVLEDRQGTLWIGTEGGGLNRLRDGEITHFNTKNGRLPGDFVYALHEDRRGGLWVGLSDGGLCRARGGRFQCYSVQDGLSSNTVWAIHDDATGTLWIGTDLGLDRMRGGVIEPVSTGGGLDRITSLLESSDGSIWVATYLGGLARIDQGQVTHYGEAEGLASGPVLALHEDGEGVLWIGTMRTGLCRLEVDRFRCFTAAAGLPNDNVLQVLEDDLGYFWLGSQQGIARLDKRALEAYAAGDSAALEAAVYGVADGMKSREMNGGAQPAAWKSKDGRLWFATLKGLVTIDPAHVQYNDVPPPVVLEELVVNGQPVSMEAGLRLPAGSRDFEFHYTGLSYIAPEQVQFKYRLEGHDDDWVEAGTRRAAYYTNLSPGTYQFQVIACNNDGVWNLQGASLAFHVAPFLYQTPWFLLACMLIVFLLGAGLYRLRVRHLRNRQRELQALVAEQTHQLRLREQELETLNKNLAKEVQRQLDLILAERRRHENALIAAKEKAEESARLKSTILMNMSHEIRTPITVILGSAQVLAKEVPGDQQEFVQYITENGRRLLETLNSILDFARFESEGIQLTSRWFDLANVVRDTMQMLTPMAKEKDIVLRAELPPEELMAYLDEGAIERVLQNLIDNAIKFTDHGEVAVRAGRHGKKVILEVRDTGIGISPEFLPYLFEEFKQESSGLTRSHGGSGLGLAITQRLINSQGGQITVESEKGKGTTFTVTFPLPVSEPQEKAVERPSPPSDQAEARAGSFS